MFHASMVKLFMRVLNVCFLMRVLPETFHASIVKMCSCEYEMIYSMRVCISHVMRVWLNFYASMISLLPCEYESNIFPCEFDFLLFHASLYLVISCEYV